MGFIQMSFLGTVMILAIIVVRALAIHKLPKKVFVLLWEAVILRLLIPFSIPSVLSVYSFVKENTPIQNTSTGAVISRVTGIQSNMNGDAALSVQNHSSGISVWFILWVIGAILCVVFFGISYLRCYFEFRTSLPVRNEYIMRWLGEQPLKRSLQIRLSDRISAPLTYGVIRPVILMPKKIGLGK